MSAPRWLASALLLAALFSMWKPVPASGQTVAAPPSPDLPHILQSLRARPAAAVQFDYIMTARVRLLIFWTGKDDVGSARIRRGASGDAPNTEWIDLLAGSDPGKAPRAINRWGSAMESFTRSPRGVESSTFFGFMKVSKGSSTAEMQQELAREKQNQEYLFSAIIDRTGDGVDFLKILPFTSDKDYTVHDVDGATLSVLDRLAGPQGRVKSVDPGRRRACERRAGFLGTVSDLVAAALDGVKAPRSFCYLYNGERRKLTLTRITPVAERSVQLSLSAEPKGYERTYHDLLLAEIKNENEDTGQDSSFRLLLGTKGELRGVPVQISYQPNWWFQVILNLKTSPAGNAPAR